MRTSQIFTAALISAFAFSCAPASADIETQTETVAFEINLDDTPEDIYSAIREQAWDACKPELGTLSALTRQSVRRDCQKDLVAEIVGALAEPAIIEMAQADGVRAKTS